MANKKIKKNSKKNSNTILSNDIFALIFFITILLFFPVISCVNSDNEKFIEELENVPLPISFIQDKEKSFIYDTPEGRIVEIHTKGRGDKKSVIDFYTESMPELGWKIEKNHNSKVTLRYIKNGEKLDIKISNAEKYNLILTFELSPYEK